MTTYHTAHLTPDPARNVVWATVARHLAPYVPQDAAVLELGAGYCDWINNVRAARRVALHIMRAVGTGPKRRNASPVPALAPPIVLFSLTTRRAFLGSGTTGAFDGKAGRLQRRPAFLD